MKVCILVFMLCFRSHVCKHYAYRQEKYSTSCGFLSWSSCTKYRSTMYSYLTCCPGYKSNGYSCPYPICDSKINPSACHKYYNNDVMIYRPGAGSPQRNSGGYCKSPEQCAGCNDGFYPDRAYCRICPRISHCKHRRCSDIPSNHCAYCDGEVVDRLYWRAYTRHKDAYGNNDALSKTCIKTCSWRADSTRCYPGTCSKEIATSCKCLDGFGGHHCDQITRDSTIVYAIAKLNSSRPGIHSIETPIDPNDPIPHATKWTNHLLIDRAYLEVMAVFKVNGYPPAPDQNGRNHFITDFKYGVLAGQMKLALTRDGNNTIPPIVKICHIQKQSPTNDIYQCREPMVQLNAWMSFLPFQHNDRVIYSFEITNGGYLKYIDRDTHPTNPEQAPRKRVDLKGRTVSRQFVFHWDLYEPVQQCVETHGIKCTVPPVLAPDVTTNSTIHLQWNGWMDHLAGIEGYYYAVFELGNDGTSLSEGQGIKIAESNNLVRSDVTSEFSVTKVGMYSVIFTAIDKAGNEKSARTLFLYDDNSHVEVENGKTIRVQQSTKDTKYVWVDVDDPILKVNWPGRFKNEMHYKQLWLESVKPRRHVDPAYDDHYGKRKTTTVPNQQGVVKFETQFIVSSPAITQKVNFVSTLNVTEEATSLPVKWNDGDKLDITVRAFDIFDSYIDDMVTVYKDTSPPEIENMWLSNGDRGNVSFYSGEDLLNMTIELNAFDYHSGIDHLMWRLYDNYTKTGIVHGTIDIASQGNVTNITDCHNKYVDASRGASCYCTHFHGCFQKHVYVKLQINNGSCLNTGKCKAVNESEYYIEVTVVNKALLKTTVVKKISVDFSAPHEGYVHDGIRGHPEIDFQQDLHIDAHWEGFFDRESDVEYYQYIFSDHCFNNDEFKAYNQTSETLNTFASFDASTKGTYFVSVVAVNGAKASSNVVCSDGVTVMTFWQ